jgi:hypothetical protein
MKNEKLLKIIIAVLGVFVITAGVYIIIGQPGNDILTEEKKWETPEREKPMTAARDENEGVDLSELPPSYIDAQESKASNGAWSIYDDAEYFYEECYSLYVDIPPAPYRGEIREEREEKPEIIYGTDYTKEGIEKLLTEYLEYSSYIYGPSGAYIVAFGEGETPVSVYFARSFDSGYIGVYGDNLVDTSKFTTLNEVYDELLRMYEEEPEKFEDPDDYYDDYYGFDYDNSSAGESVFNIYGFSSSIEMDLENYYFDHIELPEGVTVDYTIINSYNYVDRLTDDLFGNSFMADDYKVDLFVLEPSMAEEILNSDYIIPLSELGFTEEELSDQFPFTVSLTSDKNGVQKGLIYEIYPEVFIYRKTIAKSVLGTDDPAEVAELIKDRESFEAIAEKMKNSGYTMLGSYDEDYLVGTQPYTETVSYENGELVIPKAWEDWAKLEKTYIDKGYVLKTDRYSEEWSDGIVKMNTFGFIGTAWYIDDIIMFHSEYARDFAICPAPAATYSDSSWGGTSLIICAAKGTDNEEIAADIMRNLALDKVTLKIIASRGEILTNTVSGMSELASEKTEAAIFDDINPFGVYSEVAKNITNAVPRNEEHSYFFEQYKYSMEDYFLGEKTYEECYEQFSESVLE